MPVSFRFCGGGMPIPPLKNLSTSKKSQVNSVAALLFLFNLLTLVAN